MRRLGRPPYGYKVGPKKRLVVDPRGRLSCPLHFSAVSEGRSRDKANRPKAQRRWTPYTARRPLEHGHSPGHPAKPGVRWDLLAVRRARSSQPCPADIPGGLSDGAATARPASSVHPALGRYLLSCSRASSIVPTVATRWLASRGSRSGAGRPTASFTTAIYRYYQCGSRTSRSLCDYHTHRAEELEAQVRIGLGDSKESPLSPPIPERIGVRHADEVKRLRTKGRRLDRRLEQYLDAAASGGLAREQLQSDWPGARVGATSDRGESGPGDPPCGAAGERDRAAPPPGGGPCSPG